MYVDGLDTALSVATVGLAATGVGLLSTVIAVPVAIGIQAGAIVCGLLRAGGKFIGRRLQTKAKKHDQIRVLAVKDKHHRRPYFDRVTDDKVSDEEFRLILSVVDKYDRMKAEIPRRQTQGLSEHKKKELVRLARDESMMTARTKLLEELHQAGGNGTS